MTETTSIAWATICIWLPDNKRGTWTDLAVVPHRNYHTLSRRQHLGQGKDLLFSFISRHVKMLWWRNLHSMLIPKHTHVEYTKSFSSFDWLAFDPFTFLFASLYKTQANFDWDLDSTHVTVKETSFLVCGNLWWVPSTNVSWWCDVSRQNVREKFSAQLFERTGHEFGHDVARLLWLE